jgi:quercetin dioxygenase-like cupin family protein
VLDTYIYAALALAPLTAAAAPSQVPPPLYADLHGEQLLDNPRVLVERFVLQPGELTGRHRRNTDQLLVFIKGGVLRPADGGRATLWRDGRVLWQSRGAAADPGMRNAGSEPIVMIAVTLKPVASTAAPAATHAAPAQDAHLNYPNVPGEDLLENERVIVQRFTVAAGQWEGVHAHRPNMLYIHIKGGQWATRSKHEPEHLYREASPDGEVGWMPTIDISEGHESGNAGKTPIDLIWVTLKD